MGDDLWSVRGEIPMRFPDFDLPLMPDDDGNLLPWGWGAISCVPAPPGIHGCCGKRVRKHDGWLIFQDGDIACADCARRWCESNYVPDQ